MRAAPVVHHSVDLVHNECPHRIQHPATGLRSEQEIQRFRRSNEDVRRLLDERLALRGGGITGANFSAHVDFVAFCFV